MGTIIALIGALLIGLVAIVGVLVGGMRAHWPPATEAMRRLTIVLNKGQKGSGEPGATWGFLRHVGRSSGTTYETPLGIERTDDGFVIAMVYGEKTQWVRNVLAAGTAEVVLEGETYPVDRPEIIPIGEAEAWIPGRDQRINTLVGVTEAVRLYHADPS
jgi:deazaflavin-dependent oxidoreductase (nitroreductase family)